MKFLSKYKWRPILKPFVRNFVKVKDNAKQKSNLSKSGSDALFDLSTEIERFEHEKMFKFGKKKNRRLKNIPIYRLRNRLGRIEKQFKFVKIDGFKKFYNIKKTNHISGFTPDYVGFRPSSPVNFSNCFIKYFLNFNNKIKNQYPSVYKSMIKSASKFRDVWTGSPDSNTGHMRNILKDNRPKSIKAEELIKIASMSSWFKIPSLDYNDPREILYMTNYNPKSHNGHYTSKILRASEKGYSITGASRMAIDKYNQVRKLPCKNFCLWDVFAREKDSKIDHTNPNKDYTTRVVLNPEHHVTVLQSWVVGKHMKAYELSVNKDKKWFIGGELNAEKVKLIMERIDQYDFFVDTDWTQFDASADTEELLAVGSIAYSNSISSKQDLRFMFYNIMTFVQKYIVLPPGIVVEANRGNPSGHPGVTMVNCYLNLLRWSNIGFNLFGSEYDKYMDAIVYGDDGIIMFKNHNNLSKIDDVITQLGYESDPIKEKLYPTKLINHNIQSNPDFLKRRFSSEGICWNREKLFDKLFYQSKIRSVEDQLSLIKGFVETAPGDIELNSLSNDIIQWVCSSNNLNVEQFKPLLDIERFDPNITENPLKGFEWEKSILSSRIEIDTTRSQKIIKDSQFDENLLIYLTEDPYFMNDYKINFHRFFKVQLERYALFELFISNGFSEVYLNKLKDIFN